jgi:hypothetical protein
LKLRRFPDVETTSISQRRFRLRFQPFFDVDSTTSSDVVSTLFRRRFAGWEVEDQLDKHRASGQDAKAGESQPQAPGQNDDL